MKIATDTIQSTIKALLSAATLPDGSANPLAGVSILLEDDPSATAAELSAFETTFENALADKGFVLAVKTPHFVKIDDVRHQSISMRAVVPIIAFENPAVNRSPGGAGLTIGTALDTALLLLLPVFGFEETPFSPPQPLDELHTRALLPSLEVEREFPL